MTVWVSIFSSNKSPLSSWARLIMCRISECILPSFVSNFPLRLANANQLSLKTLTLEFYFIGFVLLFVYKFFCRSNHPINLRQSTKFLLFSKWEISMLLENYLLLYQNWSNPELEFSILEFQYQLKKCFFCFSHLMNEMKTLNSIHYCK